MIANLALWLWWFLYFFVSRSWCNRWFISLNYLFRQFCCLSFLFLILLHINIVKPTGLINILWIFIVICCLLALAYRCQIKLILLFCMRWCFLLFIYWFYRLLRFLASHFMNFNNARIIHSHDLYVFVKRT